MPTLVQKNEYLVNLCCIVHKKMYSIIKYISCKTIERIVHFSYLEKNASEILFDQVAILHVFM